MRLIDADVLKEEVKTIFCPDGYKIFMLQRIDNAPTVEERPQGRPLNDAINIIKETCKNYKTCVECPMNFNCNEHPAEWKEAKGDDNG